MTGPAECERVDRALGGRTDGLFTPSMLAALSVWSWANSNPSHPRSLLRAPQLHLHTEVLTTHQDQVRQPALVSPGASRIGEGSQFTRNNRTMM